MPDVGEILALKQLVGAAAHDRACLVQLSRVASWPMAKLTPEEMWGRMLNRQLSAPPGHPANLGSFAVAAALQALQRPVPGTRRRPAGVRPRPVATEPTAL